MTLPTNASIVFDLDDTLYSERDFEKSGVEYVLNHFQINAELKELLFKNTGSWAQIVIDKLDSSIDFIELLNLYRNHPPKINLYDDAKVFLNNCIENNIELNLITDGRSITQRNKLKALGILQYFKNIVISEEINSEKPSEINYKLVMDKAISRNYIYIGDNLNKDFVTPNRLGWTSICMLDRGQNVHKQNFNLTNEYLPQFSINSFNEIIL